LHFTDDQYAKFCCKFYRVHRHFWPFWPHNLDLWFLTTWLGLRHYFFKLVPTSYELVDLLLLEHPKKGVTDRQTDRQLDRRLPLIKQDFVTAKNICFPSVSQLCRELQPHEILTNGTWPMGQWITTTDNLQYLSK